jgi:ABC-2 type transport system permease protein
MQDLPQIVEQVAGELEKAASGNFVYTSVDPGTDARYSPSTLLEDYGIQPFAASLFSADTYYMHLLLQVGEEAYVLYPSGDVSEADLRAEIEAALKRAAPGFLKTVGVWNPSEEPVPSPYGQGTVPPLSTWQQARDFLSQSYTLVPVDLSSGRVPGQIDVLVVISPQGLGEPELFAIDQYLMRGGAVVLATSSYQLSPQQFGGGIMMQEVQGGVRDLLASYGIEVETAFVMDPRNEPFPQQVQRQVGNMSVIELEQVNYPFFVDVRPDSMAQESPIVSNLPAVTLHWASPIRVAETANPDRDVTVLLESTEGSWLRTSLTVDPDMASYPQYGFPVEGEQSARPLAVSVSGSFESYFKDRPSPFQEGADAEVPAAPGPGQDPQQQPEQPVLSTIPASPQSSRLVVVGSAEFLNDAVLGLSQSLSPERYLNNLTFLLNAIDWSVEDEDLLTIRARGVQARLLRDLTREQQSFWEGLNYAVALLGLVVIGVVWNVQQRGEEPFALSGETEADAREEQ